MSIRSLNIPIVAANVRFFFEKASIFAKKMIESSKKIQKSTVFMVSQALKGGPKTGNQVAGQE